MNPHNISGPQVEEEFKKKATVLTIFVFALLSILLFRLFVMQIIKGSYYEGLSQNNRLRIITVPAPRGKILDRSGIVLSDNRPAYNVMVMPEDVSNARGIAAYLSGVLNMPLAEIEAAIVKAKSKPYDPIAIARDISFDQVAMIEARIFNLPGVSIEAIPEREYLYQDLASHVMGFIGEISQKQLEARSDEGYAPGDLIGKSGIELVCDDTLKGVKGMRIFEVDARGHRVRTIDERSAVEGTDVKLTIDQNLQAIAAGALGTKAGAVVAMVPDTGEVLVMQSSPGFDPSIFTSSMTPEEWKGIMDNPMHPLENRALRGAYPPGSIMKIVVALAGFETGILNPHARVYCPGYYKIGRSVFKCWQAKGHGEVDLVDAVTQSCDVYFYTLGRSLGIENMARYASMLGLGAKTGIILKDEATGLVPTKQWKRKRFGQPWHPGENVITAIGQGYTLVTPLQIAKAMSAVVNGGKVYTPKILASGQPVLERDLSIPESSLDFIKQGLRSAVEGDRGTARTVLDPAYSIGGKTGTAQVARGYVSKLPDEADIPYKLRDHAWFFGFTPVEKPEIVVVALVEHGGHGGAIAGPIVRDVIRGYYLQKELSHEPVRQDIR